MDVASAAVTLDWTRNVFRRVSAHFPSSVKLEILLLCHFFPLSKSKTFLCNTDWLFPLFYCCVAFSPLLLPLGWSNFPSPKMTLVSSYPNSKSKRRQLKGQMVPKKHLCRVYYFKEPLNLHLVFNSKLYIFMGKKKTVSEAMPWVYVASV